MLGNWRTSALSKPAAPSPGRRLSAQAVMASACLPQLFQAPEIDGRLYWDGGYAANPALGPLVEMGESRAEAPAERVAPAV